MEREFIGKAVRIRVSFAAEAYGSIPFDYKGIVKEADDTYIKLTVSQKRNTYKDMIINKKFVIYMEEL